MEGFTLRGKEGYVQLHLEEVYGFPNETSHFGGYDARGTAEIKSGNYFVRGQLWFSTGEVFEFYEQLKRTYNTVTGEAKFSSSEVNLEFKVIFNRKGHVAITGIFKEQAFLDNELKFEIEGDQTYLEPALHDLEKFVQKYGGFRGIKD